MEAAAHSHQEHHHEPMPTSGRALNLVAVNATLNCLTGCAIGEVTGMADDDEKHEGGHSAQLFHKPALIGPADSAVSR